MSPSKYKIYVGGKKKNLNKKNSNKWLLFIYINTNTMSVQASCRLAVL